MAPRPSKPRAETLRKAGWSALTLLMFLGFLEILARRGARETTEDPHIRMDFDGDLLWGLSMVQQEQPDLQVNSLGLRGGELREEPTVRILTLGDSSVYGHGVTLDEVFSTVLAKRIEAARPPGSTALPVEPVVGAVPGYSTFQSRRFFARIADEVEPDVVIIGNLWSDAYFAAVSDEAWAAELAKTYGPWQPVVQPLELVASHSALARRLRETVHTAFFPRKDTANEIGWSHLVKPPPGPPKPPPKHGSEKLPTARVPLDSYRENLRALVAATREVGALPAFLMLPHPLDAQKIHKLPAHEMAYRQVMREVAAEAGAPLVDGPAWYDAHPWDTLRFSDDIHPDAKGHADLADATFAAFAADPAVAARLGLPQREASTQSTPGER